jgi:hypothetical protein
MIMLAKTITDYEGASSLTMKGSIADRAPGQPVIDGSKLGM